MCGPCPVALEGVPPGNDQLHVVMVVDCAVEASDNVTLADDPQMLVWLAVKSASSGQLPRLILIKLTEFEQGALLMVQASRTESPTLKLLIADVGEFRLLMVMAPLLV